MIDFCPRCRIQAPHDARRTGCPRCGGPLSVLPDVTHIPPPPAAYSPPPRPPAPPRRFRWVARRPPEALPGPLPRPQAARGPTPYYTQIPGWGLVDVIEPPTPPRRGRAARTADSMQPALLTLGALLFVAAVSQAWVYALLVINRDRPIGRLTATVAAAFSQAVGWVSVVGFVLCLLVFWAWMVDRRAQAHADLDRLDPRPWWHLAVGCLVPVVNVVGAPVLVHELARARHNLPADRVRPVLRAWWAAWLGVNLLAVVTLVIRLGADSIQWGANAVFLTMLTDLAGSAFAVGTAWLLYRVFDPSAERAPATRWLAT